MRIPKFQIPKLDLNKILIAAGTVAFLFVIAFFVWWNNEITIIGSNPLAAEDKPRSSVAGLECDNAERRPLAIMLAGDPETRPLSGIGQADMVFEMPVAPNGITRAMALYQCEDPKEIGSIRSAREDFIPLAASFGAIYAHWGGERDALNKLDAGVLDNVDALKYEGSIFYRKNSLPRPHNGFTTVELLQDKAKALGYVLEDAFVGYPRGTEEIKRNLSNIVSIIDVDYPGQYGVRWQYNEPSNTYLRYRGGSQEREANSGQHVSANAVVVMKTSSRVINQDYIRVDVTGQGEAIVYQNGSMITGTWTKDASQISSKLYFYDTNGQEIKFVPGKVWVQITTE